MTALLEIKGLRTWFPTAAGTVKAVDGVDLRLASGEILGLVGESGSGKSITGFSVLGLVDPPGQIEGGSIRFKGRDLTALSPSAFRSLRGDRIAMIFQDPMMTLNPVLSIGTQMVETVRAHRKVSRAEAHVRSAAALGRVGIPSPDERLDAYPHEFSGGMRQRVAIAMALLHEPDLIIADEPTTALDVTIQAQILSVVQGLVADMGMGLIWISHDLGVVAGLAQRIAVMYAGRIVEEGPTDDVLDRPRHPYTQGLVASAPLANARGEKLHQIRGTAPSPMQRPEGCPFRPRCDHATDICKTEPEETHDGPRRWRCFHPLGLPA